jgi:hypothetical protein
MLGDIRLLLSLIFSVSTLSGFIPGLDCCTIKDLDKSTHYVHLELIQNNPDPQINATTQSSQSVNLPYVQQNAPTATSTLSPEDPGYIPPEFVTPTVIGTPTPTPIPEQTGEFNIPIVLGAGVIILIILFAWGVFGRFKI